MATLKFEAFLGDIPYLDATGLPEQNSRLNRDCWFVDGKLQPIKEALTDGTVPEGTKTIYRYRPCPKDASQAYWITRTESYNVAPSPIPNDKFGRLYFTRKKYATGDTVELPHFYDVKGLLGRTNNTDLCTNTGTGPFPVSGATKYTLGVPSPRDFSAGLTSGYFSLGVSSDALTWTYPEGFRGQEFSFLRIATFGSRVVAGGYNGVIVYSDDDGATWSTAYTPETAVTFVIRSLAHDGTGRCIAGCENGKLLISVDNGANWSLPAYSGDGQRVADGHITAAVYLSSNSSFFIGTTGGVVKKATSAALSDADPWEGVADATSKFQVVSGGQTTINPIFDGAASAATGALYFVGGAATGVAVTRASNGTWSTMTGHDLNGPIRSINMNATGDRFVCTTTEAYQERVSSWGAKVKVHSTDFAGASFFRSGSVWKDVRAAGYNNNNSIILIGERGAFAREADFSGGLVWHGPTTSDYFGLTRLNDFAYVGGKYLLVAGDRLSSTVTVQPRYYAVTFVDGYGAESAPVLSTKITAVPGTGFKLQWKAPTFQVTEDGAVTSSGLTQTVNLNGAKYRIYRTASSGSSTDFLLVDGGVAHVIGTNDYEYTDVKQDEALAEVMLSTDWIPPPPKLRGLVTLPGGVLAGFVDNTLWFSEPGQPHAWPVKYQRTVSAPIVGLSTFANSVLITTIDRSYIASGMDPFNMALTELETDQSCISADSVVDMGGYSIYASPRGLVKVSNMNPEWLTKQLFTPAQWALLNPSTMRATLWEGRYLVFFTPPEGGVPYAAAGVKSFSLVPGADVDGIAWYSQAGDRAFTDPYDDKVYFIEGTNRKIWNAGTTNKTCLWVSKLLQSPESLNFSWLQTQTAGETGSATVRYYSEEGYTLLAEVTFSNTNAITRQTAITGKVYNSDGTQKSTFSGNVYDATARLPAGRRTRFHLVEIETDTKVRQVLFTQSALELRSQ